MQSESRFTVIIARSAEKDFEKLSQSMAKRVFAGLQRLATDPFPGAWKAVKRLWIALSYFKFFYYS